MGTDDVSLISRVLSATCAVYEPIFLTRETVAFRLGISYRSVTRLAQQGKLKTVRIGKTRFFFESEVERYAETRKRKRRKEEVPDPSLR